MKALSRLRLAFELPLLVKELNEQAARKRTYLVRFAFTVVLFAAALAVFYGGLFGSAGAAPELGEGRRMFLSLLTLEFWVLYLLVPAVASGCLTLEKERNCLALLLITSLRPWQIVVQKFLGCAIPVVGFVFISLPLVAVAYSNGGVTEEQLWLGIGLLLLTVVQTTVLSVACSAWFPTTVEALAANYALFLLFRLVMPFCWPDFQLTLQETHGSAALTAALVLTAMLNTALFVITILVVEPRAFVPPKNVLLVLFKRLDEFFNNANKVTGGVVLVKDGDPLPAARPVAWRETAKKSLGTFRYLFRVLVVMELPLLFICMALRTSDTSHRNAAVITGYLYGLWVLAAAMVIIHAGGVVAAERTRQTLDVLLATPMAGDRILKEKLCGVWRLIKVLTVPFATVIAFEFWWHSSSLYRWHCTALAGLAVVCYLPQLAWFALAAGLLIKSQIKAIVTLLLVVASWMALPSIIRACDSLLFQQTLPQAAHQVLLLHPERLIVEVQRALELITPVTEQSPEHLLPPSFGLLYANLLLNAGVWLAMRGWCLRRADRLLGRLGASGKRVAPPDSQICQAPLHQLA